MCGECRGATHADLKAAIKRNTIILLPFDTIFEPASSNNGQKCSLDANDGTSRLKKPHMHLPLDEKCPRKRKRSLDADDGAAARQVDAVKEDRKPRADIRAKKESTAMNTSSQDAEAAMKTPFLSWASRHKCKACQKHHLCIAHDEKCPRKRKPSSRKTPQIYLASSLKVFEFASIAATPSSSE
mmetsp:Transcript_48653/g.146663  ORF Transcript_48653/g.146663 Transcript_48653/m.146663 type:complete len:184 (-) Transcript_48653:287-838(-)